MKDNLSPLDFGDFAIKDNFTGVVIIQQDESKNSLVYNIKNGVLVSIHTEILDKIRVVTHV